MSNRISTLETALCVASRLGLVGSHPVNKRRLSPWASVGCAVAMAMMLAHSPASAQLFFSRRLPPGQIATIVQSQGYRDPTYPYFRGDIYVVDAREPRGTRVRLVIDPKSGEIVERLFIRQQTVMPGADFDNGYIRPNPQRIVNPNEEAAGGPRLDSKVHERKRPKRTARRPAERSEDTPNEVATPNVTPSETRPEAGAPQETPSGGTMARPTRTQTPARDPSSIAATPPASAETVAPASGERGTKINPRRVGPVVPPAVGVE